MRKTIDKQYVFDNLKPIKELLRDVKFEGKELTKDDIDKMYTDIFYLMKQCSI
jgi:hypothetical protein